MLSVLLLCGVLPYTVFVEDQRREPPSREYVSPLYPLVGVSQDLVIDIEGETEGGFNGDKKYSEIWRRADLGSR